jgi:hypothetical protein
MEADFYKFRGRGIIQTTGRNDYRPLIEFILTNPQASANTALAQIASTWTQQNRGIAVGQLLDTAASISTNIQWDAAFGEAMVLAAGVSIDSNTKGSYLNLGHDAETLNGGIGTRGSLYFMARRINGGSYPDQVVPMMKAMISAVSDFAAPVRVARLSRLTLDGELSPAA